MEQKLAANLKKGTEILEKRHKEDTEKHENNAKENETILGFVRDLVDGQNRMVDEIHRLEVSQEQLGNANDTLRKEVAELNDALDSGLQEVKDDHIKGLKDVTDAKNEELKQLKDKQSKGTVDLLNELTDLKDKELQKLKEELEELREKNSSLKKTVTSYRQGALAFLEETNYEKETER